MSPLWVIIGFTTSGEVDHLGLEQEKHAATSRSRKITISEKKKGVRVEKKLKLSDLSGSGIATGVQASVQLTGATLAQKLDFVFNVEQTEGMDVLFGNSDSSKKSYPLSPQFYYFHYFRGRSSES
ncbi:hypothetical protein Tco_1379302 [Tanacetum coccineum]